MEAVVAGEFVKLPSELVGFFAPEDRAEVIPGRDRIVLWRTSVRRAVRGTRLASAPKADDVDLFWRAYQRYHALLDERAMRQRHADAALYLSGLLVELRLKVAICDRHRKGRLSEAQLALGKADDREYGLLGGQGHDLPLLWRLAGFGPGAMGQLDDYRLVTEWDVSWRYAPPEEHVQEYTEFRTAVDRVCRFIDMEVSHVR